MPNLDEIKQAVCGKRLASDWLVVPPEMRTTSRLATTCRCFVGELLHEAGVSDEEMLNSGLNSDCSATALFSAWPVLDMKYGLDVHAVHRIMQVNDFCVDSTQRTRIVLKKVFDESCEVPDAE